MTIIISATDAKNRLGQLLRQIARGDHVVIERNGKRVAAIVSADDLDELERRREADRRRRALMELERLNAEWMASGSGLDDEAAERFGVELGKEINRAVAERLSSADARAAE